MNNNDNKFRGNEFLKAPNQIEYITKEELEYRAKEFYKCKKDITYFAEKYYTIIVLGKGKQLIKLYPKQAELLNTIKDNDRVVTLASRQTGKSTTYCIFLLWYGLFHEDKTALIVANKEKTALSFIGRIRMAYELLPQWLKPGIDTWNKGTIKFSNGSTIYGEATSEDSGRSGSCDILVIDECVIGNTKVILRNKKTKKIKCINIKDLYKNEYK